MTVTKRSRTEHDKDNEQWRHEWPIFLVGPQSVYLMKLMTLWYYILMIWYLFIPLHRTYKSVLAYIDLNDFYFLSMTSKSMQESQKIILYRNYILICLLTRTLNSAKSTKNYIDLYGQAFFMLIFIKSLLIRKWTF